MKPRTENTKSIHGSTVSPQRQLGSGLNKVERIAQHSRSIFDEIKEWAELRIELVRLEVKHEIEAKKNEIVVMAVVGTVSALGLLFSLAALALGIGALLGHPGWGFLIVSLLLFLIAGVYWSRMGPRRMQRAKELIIETANPDPKDEKHDPKVKKEVKHEKP